MTIQLGQLFKASCKWNFALRFCLFIYQASIHHSVLHPIPSKSPRRCTLRRMVINKFPAVNQLQLRRGKGLDFLPFPLAVVVVETFLLRSPIYCQGQLFTFSSVHTQTRGWLTLSWAKIKTVYTSGLGAPGSCFPWDDMRILRTNWNASATPKEKC